MESCCSGEHTIWQRQQASRTANGSDSSRDTSDTQPPKLFSSWFCPYAQRAWLALEESGANYSWVEIQPVRPISTGPHPTPTHSNPGPGGVG